MVRLKVPTQPALCGRNDDFNSSMVRLKVDFASAPKSVVTNFNSSMVRLKAKVDIARECRRK